MSQPVKLYDLLDLADLRVAKRQGYVSQQTHPSGGMGILNYTPQATFDHHWDKVTTLCRGLVVDTEMNVLARPFQKFFNLNTEQFPETHLDNLPKDVPVCITEKLDGSLGILYTAPDSLRAIATRGSFTSPQAVWATSLLRSKYSKTDWPTDGWTPLFEIVYKENRIVVDYKFEDIVLLGMVHLRTGEEMEYGKLCGWAEHNGMRVTNMWPGSSLTPILAEPHPANSEGYVASFNLGKCPPLKVKIKWAEYQRLHRLITGANPRVIWEILRDNGSLMPLLDETLPAGFRSFVADWVKILYQKHAVMVDIVEDYFNKTPIDHNAPLHPRVRGEIAAYFSKLPEKPLIAALFMMLDGKDWRKYLWERIEPKGNAILPYRQDGA